MKKIGFDRKMLGVIFSLAWPTMLEELMQTAVQYIDTAMVGALGTRATAAVGATSTVNWLVGSVVSAVGVGFLAYISQANGAGEQDKVKKASAQAVMVTLFVGILMTLLTTGLSGMVPVWMQVSPEIRELASQYFFILYLPMLFRSASIIFGTVLRAAGDTRTPMRVGVLVNVMNVFLNLLLIFPTRKRMIGSVSLTLPGMGMGVRGAAAASAIAFTVGGILISLHLWKHPQLTPKGQSMKPDVRILRPCFCVAAPNLLQRFGTSLGYVAFASMINALGETAAAAHTIANTVESLFYIPGWGMQTSAATLAGNALGARDYTRLRCLTATILPVEIALMTVSGGLLFLFAPVLVRLFTADAAVILLGVTVLRMVAISEPIYGVPIVLEGIMQGVGKTVAPFVYNIIGMWGVRILCTFLCTRYFGMGLVSAWGCMIGHNLLLFILFIAHYRFGKVYPEIE